MSNIWGAVQIYDFFITLYIFYSIFIITNFNYDVLNNPIEFFIVLSIQVVFVLSSLVYLYFLWFSKSKEDLLFRNIIIITTGFVLLSFPITYAILFLGRNLSSINNIKIGTADGWLSFIGSILGGIITMLALFFTLQSEQTKRTEEKGIKSLPYLKAKSITSNEELREKAAVSFPTQESKKLISSDSFYVDFSIVFENTSSNIASEFVFDRKNSFFEVYTLDHNYIIDSINIDNSPDINPFLKFHFDQIGFKNNVPVDLYPSETLTVPIVVPKSIFDVKRFKNESLYKYRLKLSFKFNDIYKINQYTYSIDIKENVSVENNYTFKGKNPLFDVLEYAKKEFRREKSNIHNN